MSEQEQQEVELTEAELFSIKASLIYCEERWFPVPAQSLFKIRKKISAGIQGVSHTGNRKFILKEKKTDK